MAHSSNRWLAALTLSVALSHCKSDRRDEQPSAPATAEPTSDAPADSEQNSGASSSSAASATTVSTNEVAPGTPANSNSQASVAAGTGRAAWDMPVVSTAAPMDFAGVGRAVEAYELLRVWARAQREGDSERYLARYHTAATVVLPTAAGKSERIVDVAKARLELLNHKSEAAIGMQIMAPIGPDRSGLSVDTELCTRRSAQLDRCHRLQLDLEPNEQGHSLLKREVHHADYPFAQRSTHVPRLRLTAQLKQLVLVRGPCDPHPERHFKLLHPEECERYATMLALVTEDGQYYIDLVAPGMSRVSDVLDEFATPDSHTVVWQTPEVLFRIRKNAKRITIERRDIDPELAEPNTEFVPAAEVSLTVDNPVPFYCSLYAEKKLRQCLPTQVEL